MTKPAKYWRSTQTWKEWLGKRGRVVASTIINVAEPHLKDMAPYSYVIVDFGKEKKEFMGVVNQTFSAGDEVECVLRRFSVPEKSELIQYGIKVSKVTS
jgi:uncharacterized OB-fold protein